jgi:hypothetical protein
MANSRFDQARIYVDQAETQLQQLETEVQEYAARARIPVCAEAKRMAEEILDAYSTCCLIEPASTPQLGSFVVSTWTDYGIKNADQAKQLLQQLIRALGLVREVDRSIVNTAFLQEQLTRASSALDNCANTADVKALYDAVIESLRSHFDDKGLPAECPVIVTNCLVNLRSALDRCARELFERFGTKTSGKSQDIHFPIRPRGTPFPKGYTSFADWVNRRQIPGLNDNRPALVTLLEGFQEFKDPVNYDWMPDFATLTNKNKHEEDDPSTAIAVPHISLGGLLFPEQTGNVCVVNSTINGQRIDLFTMAGGHGSFFRGDPGIQLQRVHASVRFDAVDQLVFPFLDRAIRGVRNMVESMIKAA